ncbi:MAG: HNH endonuclease [Bdellovibrionales bacterium]|nr:HNH endonuclease [Bdellovibrionales bacterium]
MSFESADLQHIKKERAKAKKLRSTSWWQNKLKKEPCYFCKKRFPKEKLTMDHLIPLVKGGFSIKNNLVVSCKDCNSSKKYHTIIEQRLNALKKSSTDK